MGFDELYIEYFQAVYAYLLSISHDGILAEELTQETFFKALKKIDSFKEGTNAKAWLCQIAKNLFYDHSKRIKKDVNFDNAIMEQLVHELYPNIDESLYEKDLTVRVHKILHKLDEPYKEVFNMRVFGELSFSDIGEIFDKSDGWARVTYYRATNKIKEELKNEGQL
mgnify:CR=1 FL=1